MGTFSGGYAGRGAFPLNFPVNPHELQIQMNGLTSKAAGYAESKIAGSVVRLICIDATEWIADTIIGTWDLETS